MYAAIRACALADRNGDPAHGGGNPREPMDLWMASALVDLILGAAGPSDCAGSGSGAASPGGGCRARAGTVINVTIPVTSLAGLSDEPGVVNGFGVIPAAEARRLAAGDARWRHVLTCRTSGAVLDVGTLSYRPPAPLDRHVRLRDGTCRFPGCAVPARECDLDHLIPFPIGPTSARNLHALCRRHHGLKHEGGWRVEALPGGALRWTSPQGATAPRTRTTTTHTWRDRSRRARRRLHVSQPEPDRAPDREVAPGAPTPICPFQRRCVTPSREGGERAGLDDTSGSDRLAVRPLRYQCGMSTQSWVISAVVLLSGLGFGLGAPGDWSTDLDRSPSVPSLRNA